MCLWRNLQETGRREKVHQQYLLAEHLAMCLANGDSLVSGLTEVDRFQSRAGIGGDFWEAKLRTFHCGGHCQGPMEPWQQMLGDPMVFWVKEDTDVSIDAHVLELYRRSVTVFLLMQFGSGQCWLSSFFLTGKCAVLRVCV